MIGRLRQLLETRLRQQAGIEKSQTPVERDIFVQWVRKVYVQPVQTPDIAEARHFSVSKTIPYIMIKRTPVVEAVYLSN